MKRKTQIVKIAGKTYYRQEVSPVGAKKRKYKTFKSLSELEKYVSVKDAFEKKDASGFLAKTYSVEQLADIKSAMEILPRGLTLTEAVKKLVAYKSSKDLKELIKEFLSIQTNRNLSYDHSSHIVSHLNAFSKKFKNFDEITPEAILKWLLSLNLAPKTIANYKGTIATFFDYCFRKDYIPQNPMLKIGSIELPSITEVPKGFLSISQTRDFFEMLKQKFPHLIKFYALALFAGIRIEEINRMQESDIDAGSKKLFLPQKIQKTKRADIIEDIEPNFWDFWNEKYPFEKLTKDERKNFKKFLNFDLPHNFARHSFATYHFSLYLDAKRTCAITRHSEEMLKRHYLSQRVAKETAQEYFNIRPTSR